MDIKMNNVNFGEYIEFFENENVILTVDCGSTKPSSLNLINIKKNLDKPILITHFHRDHLNGFINASKKYEKKVSKLYLPKYSSRIIDSNVELAMKDIIIYGKKTKSIAYKYLTGFHNILSLCDTNDITFLSRGDIIPEVNGEVLWPDISNYNYYIDGFQMNEINKIKLEHREAYKTFKKSFSDIITAIVVKDKILDNNQNNDNLANAYVELIKKFKQYILSSNITYKYSTTFAKKFSSNENNYSIVFSVNGEEGKSLFTGDISFSYLKRCATKNDYYLIKYPHHGTNKWDFDGVVSKVIISCGKYKKNWNVTDKLPDTNIHCTNANVLDATGCSSCLLYEKLSICPNNHKCHNGDISITL